MSCVLRKILFAGNVHSAVINQTIRTSCSSNCKSNPYPTIEDNTSPAQRIIFDNFLKQKGKVSFQQVRHAGATGIFNRYSADFIWKTVTSVSNAGRKRGRGRGMKNKIRDLNKGQIMGIGKANIRFPGLSSPVLRGRELVQQEQLPPDPNYQKNLEEIRDKMGKAKTTKLSPLDRGYCGNKLPGRKIGPPDPIGEDTFEGFESIVLELKPVYHMTRNFGRYRSISCLCITGNRNGLLGFSRATAPEGKTAVTRAKNKSGLRLAYINRYNDHTVLHDFYTRFCNTKIHVWKKPEGYGYCCHRVIKSICEIIGIKNIAAKVEGSTNVECILKAFLLGLLRQKSHQQLADETGFHVVEFSAEHGNFPKVIASPVAVKTDVDEVPVFSRYILSGNIYSTKFKQPPKASKYPIWGILVRKAEHFRNFEETKRKLIAEYGSLRSFLTPKYPECKPFLPPWSKVVKDAKKLEESQSGEQA